MIAAVFPGQGSQHVGMCHDFYTQFETVRRVFQEVEDTLHQSLTKVMFEGSESDLRATDYAQPALFATSTAILRLLEEELDLRANQWGVMAGHSLGEYTALHGAGVLSLEQTLTLIKLRGQAMATIKNGGMVAVLGLSHEVLSNLAQGLNHEGIPCFLANDNSPQQGVLSAHLEHLPLLVERSRTLGALKSVVLKVSGPFHCALMRSAQDQFTPLLDIMPFCAPQCPLVTNISGRAHLNPMVLKDHARQQMTHPVLWRQSQLSMAASGITHMVEIGAGKVLCGLAKKTIPHVHTHALNSVAALREWEPILALQRREAACGHGYGGVSEQPFSPEILSAVGGL